jgi:uncharacterized coiled-coil protein SlyX
MASEKEAVDTVTQAVAGAGGVGGFLLLLRWAVRTFSAERLAVKSDSAEGSVIDRLQGEITRLEALVAKMQMRLDDMQGKVDRMGKRLSGAYATMVAMEAIIEGTCNCDTRGKEKLKELVQAMKEAEER